MKQMSLLSKVLLILLVLFIVIPIIMPIIFSFSTFWQGILPQGFTVQWYGKFLKTPSTSSALGISLIVAFSAVFLNVLIAVPASLALNHFVGRTARVLDDSVKILPLIFPAVIVGTSLMQSFTKPPLALSGSLFLVIIAHTLLGFPFMIRTTMASIHTIDERSLSEAGASLGANIFQRLYYIILPNVFTGVISGALMVFAVSIGEFEVTSLVAGFTAQTLPLQLFQQMRVDMRVASAITAFLIYVSLASFILITFLGGKLRGKK